MPWTSALRGTAGKLIKCIFVCRLPIRETAEARPLALQFRHMRYNIYFTKKSHKHISIKKECEM